MPEIGDYALGQVVEIPPLPPFADPCDVLHNSLPFLDAASRIPVSEAAARHVRVETRGVWSNFDPDVTPYMIEPANTTTSRLYKGGAFLGPAQSGKTMALITTALHPVLCDQDPVLVIHMDRPSRDRWVEQSLNPVIYNSPEVFDRLGKSRDDDTFSRKRFRGMVLNLGYPTPQWLSSAKYRLVALTDYDHFPPELGVRKDAPEGSPFDMALVRVRTFLSRGFVLAESTPAWPVEDSTWEKSPEHPHMFPPVKFGIVKLYNAGTRGRWYWECRDCSKLYEPDFDHLHFDPDLPPMRAGKKAEMACPHCGSLIGPQHKNEMNRAALRGRGGWLHERQDGNGLVPLGDSAIRESEIASWALDGAAASFSNWAELVSRFIERSREARDLGDEQALARFVYTDLGKPFRRLRGDGEDELGVQFLKDHAGEGLRGVVPDWALFITVSIDVQGSYFPVQVTAWGPEGQGQIVDRFDLTQPPDDAPGGAKRKLQPGKWLEDWAVLAPLADRVWPVEGQGYGLKAAALSVDYQGEAGVSDNAEAFWNGRRAKGQGRRWFLTRGQGGWKVPRFVYAAPERKSGGGKGRQIKLLTIGTDRMKDTVSSAFLKASGEGRGALRIGQWMLTKEHADWIAEFVAEERSGKGWEKKAGQVRNEGTDLTVQARTVAEYLGLLKLGTGPRRAWAVAGPENSLAVDLTEDAAEPRAPEAADAAEPAPEKRKTRSRYKVTKMNFLRR